MDDALMNPAVTKLADVATTEYTVQWLRAYEDQIADLFAQGKIASPIHLAGGNEQQLIDIFKTIDVKNDYVLAGWRSHLHALLKGVPPEKLTAEILKGHSVSLVFPEHKFFCSGIVGGIAPIAVGLAWAEKKKADASHTGLCAKVHCFLGDMAAEAGVTHEAMKYAAGHDLPVKWIIEDNEKSVGTLTQASWGQHERRTQWDEFPDATFTYSYELSWPHSGTGKWVNF